VSRRAAWLTAGVLAGVACALIVFVLFKAGGREVAPVTPAPSGSYAMVTATGSRAGTPEPDPTTSAPATSSPTQAPPYSQAGLPVHIYLPTIGVDAAVATYTADDAAAGVDGTTGQPCLVDGVITCVDPPLNDTVYWQQGGANGVGYGDQPGEDSQGNVYLYGHAGVRGTGAVFDNLGQLQPGDTFEVTTTLGILTYQVDEVWNVDKNDYTSDPRIIDQVPGRLLLVTCDHRAGAELVNGGYAANNLVASTHVVVGAAKPLPDDG
jgi:LPXTG-site transpeptidase (sortase) family protein